MSSDTNCDSILPSSREEVDGNSPWNQFLLSEFLNLFVSSQGSFYSFHGFKDCLGKGIFILMSYVPLLDEVHDFFGSHPRMIISKLCTSNYLLLEGQNEKWVPPYRDIVLSDSLARALGIKSSGPKISVKMLSSLCHTKYGLTTMGHKWLSFGLNELHSVSIQNTDAFKGGYDVMNTIRKMPFIPLLGGYYSSIKVESEDEENSRTSFSQAGEDDAGTLDQIASLLLPGGQTAHSRFVIPRELMENDTCVIPKGKRPEIVQACINMSELWKSCKVFMLTHSMRVNEYSTNGSLDARKQQFNKWVLDVGDRTLPAKKEKDEDEETWIKILEEFIINSAHSPIEKIVKETYQLGEEYHAVPHPHTRIFMPPKPDLVFHDASIVNETAYTAFKVELSPTKPDKDLSHTHRPSAPIIKDWVFDSEDDSEAEITQIAPSLVQPIEQVKPLRPSVKPVENSILAANHKTSISKPKSHRNSRKACFVLLTRSKFVLITAARPVTTAVPKPHMTRLRPAKTIVTKPHSPPRRHINNSQSPKPSNFPPKVTTVKTPIVNGNPHHALKNKGVIDSGCSRHMIGNISYLSDFKEINGGYVIFGGNSKGGKSSGKGKIRTGKLDFDEVYFVKELFNLFSVSQMCDKKNIILFTDT
nr:hypothetical protein [Tanacetum cinerariifolium]